MSAGEQLGRLEYPDQPIFHDAPSQTMSAVLSKLDELINMNKALNAKLDSDVGVADTDYASLLSDDVSLIDLSL